MSLARKFASRKAPVHRISKPNSNRPRSSNSISPRLSLQTVATVKSEPSTVDTIMSHLADLQAAPEADMSPIAAASGPSSPGGNEPTVPVWNDSLSEGQRQLSMLYTKCRKNCIIRSNGGVPEPKEERELQARLISTRSFLFYLEFDFPAERAAMLKREKIDATLKFMEDHSDEGFLPSDISDKCTELYKAFNDDKWGAQETDQDTSAEDVGSENATTTTPRRRKPAAGTEGTVLERLPPTNHPIWGLRGIMHGLMLTGTIRRSYRFDPRYTSEKRNAKVFGHNGLTPGDWWPMLLIANFHGAHGTSMRGIAGHPDHGGAWSIIVAENPKYAHLDVDEGETIFYSSDDSSNEHNRDSVLVTSTMTMSLQKSRQTRNPVRVLRKKGAGNNRLAPLVGLRYDGLYRVVEEYEKTRPGQGGKFLQFKLVRLPNQRDFRETVRAAPTQRQQEDFYKIQEDY